MTMSSVASTTQMESLFRQHNSWLNGWLRRQRRTIDGAEDVASEVFLRLLTMPNLGDLREPRAMMTTVARRVIYELRRRNDLLRAYEDALTAMPQSTVPSPEEQIIMMEALRAIDEMLSTLSTKARAAFLYSQIDGMKYADIAERLGVSVSMVRKYVAEGLRRAYAFDPARP